MTSRFEIFTIRDLEKIHAATLRVLESTGIRILEKEAVGLLQSAGASFDDETDTVRIPEDVLMYCISSTPAKFKLYSRDGARCLRFGEGEVHLSSIGTAVQVEGLDGIVRPSTLKDLESFLRLTDALPNIDHSSLVCWPRDVPDDMAHMHSIYTGFKNTNKSIDGQNWGAREAEESISLAVIAAGGREELEEKPLLLGFSSPVSPLTLSKEGTEGLISFARAGQPCVYPPECMAGGTSPVTIAGLLVQQNAEVLASVAIAQLARRGAPSVYSSVSGTMDMRMGTIALGAPEVGLIMAGTAQLARLYKMPCRGTGGNTDAMDCDYQAGAETAATIFMAAMAGIDFVYDAAGSIESSLTASYTKLVLDDSVCGGVKRVLSGSVVSDDTLATEVIEAVHSEGTYLGHPHTLGHFRKESYIPPMFWRGSRRAWDAGGGTSLKIRAARRVEEILDEHDIAVPLDPEVDLKMKEYIKEVSRRHGT